MKRLVFSLLVLLLGAGTVSAQSENTPRNGVQTGDNAPPPKRKRAERPPVRRFEVGIRGGVNFADYSFQSVRLANSRFAPGPVRTGYDLGLVLRLNLSRHLHLQSELDYAFVNYAIHTYHAYSRTVSLRTERLEIPVQIGFQFGVIRLFGGVQFRVAETQRSSAPQLLRVGFNDNDIGVMGGAGLRIRKFFLEFRISGYPRSRVWHEFLSEGVTRRVEVSHDIVYGGSLGFFF